MRLPDPPLLLVTDRRQAARPLAEVVEAACAAGCRWISVREKDLPEPEQIGLVAALRPLARQYGAMLTLHGSAGLARKAGADGVHLPSGGDVTAARALLGPRALLGLSIHSANEAIDPAADYVIAGPAYETASKPGYGPALGPDGLAALVRATPKPMIAIGGIGPDQAAPLRAAEVAGIAVMGGIMRAADPGDAFRRMAMGWWAAKR